MKIWNKWTTALYERERWISEFGHLPELQYIRTEIQNLGNNFTVDDLAVFLDNLWYCKVPRCDECGKQSNEQEVIELGEMVEEVERMQNRIIICLPCLIKALQMLDS